MIFSPGWREPVPYSLLSVEIRPAENPEHTHDGLRAHGFVTGGAYSLLFLFGAAQGLIGCFQFRRGAGPVPLAALGFCILILATCVLGAAAMDSAAGALLPAAGWFLVTVVLTLPTAQGSVIVTNSAAGEWYLYGGSACAVAGAVIALMRRIRDTAAGRRPAARHGLSARGAGL